jgi:hypothetical protein
MHLLEPGLIACAFVVPSRQVTAEARKELPDVGDRFGTCGPLLEQPLYRLGIVSSDAEHAQTMPVEEGE